MPIYDIDLDDLFAYKVERRVVIRDRRLGLARVTILLGLFIYVVIYEVIMQKGYLQRDEPIGFATATLRRNGWDADEKQCCPPAGCGFECGAPVGSSSDVATSCAQWTQQPVCLLQPACIWTNTPSLTAFSSTTGQLECVEWDRLNILYPSAEEYSFFITTRVTVSTSVPQAPHCVLNKTSAICPPWEDAATPQSFYTTGISDMTLKIDHGVYGKETTKIVRGPEMHSGKLINWNGDTAVTLQNRELGDIFSVDTLLAISGIDSLDIKLKDIHTEEEAFADTNNTLRYDGIVLLVLIGYDGEGLDSHISYEYRSFPLRAVNYKSEQVMYRSLPNGNVTRGVWNRHGIRVVVSSAGYLAVFSFVELMKTLMVASALLSISQFIVEQLIIRLLPLSSSYRRYRDVKTVDFSEFSKEELKKLSDEDFSLGVVRGDATGVKGGIQADEEREVGDKLDEKHEKIKAENPLPPLAPPAKVLPPPPGQGGNAKGSAQGTPGKTVAFNGVGGGGGAGGAGAAAKPSTLDMAFGKNDTWWKDPPPNPQWPQYSPPKGKENLVVV